MLIGKMEANSLQRHHLKLTMMRPKLYKARLSQRISKAMMPTQRPDIYSKMLSSITVDATEHPHDLTRLYIERFKVSRVTANKYIKRLESEGWIARSGPSTHPVFSPGFRRRISKYYSLAGLDEQTPWQQDFEPYVSLRQNIRSVAHLGFTEMLNNAIDHSQGAHVHCYLSQSTERLFMAISDDGIGIFRKIASALQLPDLRQALLELSKGKFTTDPARHSGEGVFFTSRMFDSFEIEANDLKYEHVADQDDDWLIDAKASILDGTSVYMDIALSSARTPKEVYDQYTSGPDDFTFSKTVIPIRLARLGQEQLVSRSQAKRLIARFDRFKTVLLDFSDINEIGQAFADEIFRVYVKSHPEVELVPINMAEQVERMYLRIMQSAG